MRITRARARLAAAATGLFLVLPLFSLASPATAQAPGQPIDLRGYATGQPAHVSALEFGGTRIANAAVAWSGASVDADADGLATAQRNEMNRIVQPALPGKMSYARGSGLEVGLGTGPDDENQIQLIAKAEADAPPSSSATEDVAIEGLDPLAYAELLRGQAVANANESGLVPDICVLGDDISRGLGRAANVQLIDTGGDSQQPELNAPLVGLTDPDPARAVSNSVSRMRLVPGAAPNNFGLMAEVRQTIAPITLLAGDPEDPTADLRTVTIEVLGEWVLRVVANGSPGGASVFYGPGEVSPQTPILRILDSVGEQFSLNFQDLFSPSGPLPGIIEIPGLAEIVIGEDPRAIAAPGTAPDYGSSPQIAANGTSASAAVDVVRIRLLNVEPGTGLADIRAGHMEVSTQVPVGGVNCPIPVSKSADPDAIRIGEHPEISQISITVHNVFDCDMTDVVLIDRIRQEQASPNFRLVAANPTPVSPSIPTEVLTQADVEWHLGTIPRGTTSTVTLDLQSATTGGVLRDIAEASARFENCLTPDATGLAIAGLTATGLSRAVDIAVGVTAVTGALASQTALVGGGLFAAAGGLGMFLRRRFLRSR